MAVIGLCELHYDYDGGFQQLARDVSNKRKNPKARDALNKTLVGEPR